MRKPMLAAVVVGGLVALPTWGADVPVSSGTFSAAGVQPGDAVTVTGTCENDIEGLSLASLTFSGDASCELTGKDLTLGAGGLVAGTDDEDATAVTNVVRCGIALSAAQTWSIQGTARELHLYGSLDTTTDAYALTRNGKGVWRLYADTFGDGDITLAKGAGQNYGHTYAYGPNCAFGSAKSTLTIKGASPYNSKDDATLRDGAKLHLCGTVVSNGVVKFDGYYSRVGSGQQQYWIFSEAAERENVIHGQVRFAGGQEKNRTFCVVNPTGQTVVFDGGGTGLARLLNFSSLDPGQWSNSNIGTCVITNGAWAITAEIGTQSLTAGPGTFVFGAPGSTIGGKIYWHGADITFTEDWTLGSEDATATTGLGLFANRFSNNTQFYNGCPVHFRGTRQRIGGFAQDVKASASFDGTEGSVFYCRQTSDVTVAAPFTGDLSFVKEGDGGLTLTEPATTTGTLGVTEGTLTLTEAATWSNTTNVLVAGTATLSVSNAATFAAKPAVSVADGATLDLAFAGTVKVASLTLGGVAQSPGVYGPVGSGAANETSALTGTGVFKVGKMGLALIIR